MDLDRIKRNVAKMAAQNAPEADIDGYIANEGATVDEVRAHKGGARKLSELDQRMDARVAKQAAAGFKPLPSPAQYLPFGSWLDEAAAGLDAGLGYVTGGKFGAPSYAEAKAYQDARQRYIDNNASGLAKGAAMLGGVAASLPVTAAANVFRGTTLLPQMGNAALTGAGYGALYGAGEGEGGDRVGNAATGAVIGAGTGAAIVPVARGVGNAINYARNRRAPLPPELQQFERGAVNRVADDMAADGVNNVNQVRINGDEGMLADAGENLTASAEVLAQTQGPQLPIVRGEMNARQTHAPARVGGSIDAELGHQGGLQDFVDAQRQRFSRAARPAYEQFYQTMVRPSERLQTILDRAQAAGAYGRAQQIMQIEGIDPNTPQNSGRFLDLIKQSIDDMAGAADRAGERGMSRRYSQLARQLREEVDSILSPQNPQRSSWAIARRLAGTGLEGEEAAELGRGVFRGKRDPDQVLAELGGMSAYGQSMYRRGARDDFRQMLGQASTNFGPRGDTQVRRSLNSHFNRRNMQELFGRARANRLTQMVEAQNRMAETFNQVMTNSATARRQAGQSRLPMGAGAPVATEAPRGFGEAAFAIARRGANALMNGALGERAGRIMQDQARLLTARGIDRDTYVQALLNLANQRNVSAQMRDTITMMLNAVGQQSRTPLIEAATSQ